MLKCRILFKIGGISSYNLMKNHFIIAHEYQVLGLEVGVSEGYETIKKRNHATRNSHFD